MSSYAQIRIQHADGSESCEIIHAGHGGTADNVWNYWFQRSGSGLVFKNEPGSPTRRVYPYGAIRSYEVEVIEDEAMAQQADSRALGVIPARHDSVWNGHDAGDQENSQSQED
jgi:hypothetical protein